MVFFILVLTLAFNASTRSKHSEDAGFGGCMTVIIVIVDIIKIIEDYNTRRLLELIIIIGSFVAGCCAWAGQENVKVRHLFSALALTASLHGGDGMDRAYLDTSFKQGGGCKWTPIDISTP